MPGQTSNLAEELSEAQGGEVTHPRSHSSLVATWDAGMRTLALHCVSLAALFLFPGSHTGPSLFPQYESPLAWGSAEVRLWLWLLAWGSAEVRSWLWLLASSARLHPAAPALLCSPRTLSRLWSSFHLAGSLVLSLRIQDRNKFDL